MGICNFRSFFTCAFNLFLFFAFLEIETIERWFFQIVHLCLWVTAGHELGTLSIRIHNSLIVYGNSQDLKFDTFSEFQNVISDSIPPPHPQRHYDALRTIIDT